MTEQKINVNGIDINYVKVGTGPRTVLLLPGALGSIWNDFKHQIENLNRDEFTIVAWDPPGYGKSRPPDRVFTENFFAEDAILARDLMIALGYEKFSMIGWSDGGISGIFIAAKFPENVKKMIIVAVHAYLLPEELRIHKSLRNFDSWSQVMKAPLITAYGASYAKATWESRIDIAEKMYEKNNGDICKDLLAKIECPTLIVHGSFDIVVHRDHPQFLNKHIKNSRLKIFQTAGHDSHQSRYQEFNSLATDFLLGD